jgi:hypothetical protein
MQQRAGVSQWDTATTGAKGCSVMESPKSTSRGHTISLRSTCPKVEWEHFWGDKNNLLPKQKTAPSSYINKLASLKSTNRNFSSAYETLITVLN